MINHGFTVAIININCKRQQNKKDEDRGPKIIGFEVSLTFNTTAAVQERSNVSFDSARAHQLVSDQIGVVGG